MKDKRLRNELKYVIRKTDFAKIRGWLECYVKPDPYTIDNMYHVRSLYFDTLDSKDLQCNLDGLFLKEKFRLRYYMQSGQLRLERKVKIGEKGYKDSVSLSRDEGEKIVRGDFSPLKATGDKMREQFYVKMAAQVYVPKTIILFDRTPYVYGVEDTRITFDTAVSATDVTSAFFDERITSSIPILDGRFGILEVKYNRYIVGVLQEVFAALGTNPVANSKYTLARMYNH